MVGIQVITSTQDNPLVASTIVSYTGSFLNDLSAPRYMDWNPYYHVSPATVPTILFQGDADIVVFKNQSQQLQTVLNNNHVPDKLILYAKIFHDWWAVGNLVNNTLDETAAWFNKY
ncbi:MAG: prolyl oligopeptidase family serine peptidase [Ginsengibacter sp.]